MNSRPRPTREIDAKGRTVRELLAVSASSISMRQWPLLDKKEKEGGHLHCQHL